MHGVRVVSICADHDKWAPEVRVMLRSLNNTHATGLTFHMRTCVDKQVLHYGVDRVPTLILCDAKGERKSLLDLLRTRCFETSLGQITCSVFDSSCRQIAAMAGILLAVLFPDAYSFQVAKWCTQALRVPKQGILR